MSSPDPFPSLDDAAFLNSQAALPRRPRRHESSAHGAARLAREEDLRRWLSAPAGDAHATALGRLSPLVESSADGSTLEVLWHRALVFPEIERNRHLLVVSQPGGGKTQGFVLPLLWSDLQDRERTIVVFDAKGEILPFLRLALDVLRPGTRLQVLNFADRTRSLGWNPLEELGRGPGEQENGTHEIAHTLCWATETRTTSSDSVFFLNCAIALIAGVCQALLRERGEQACFARVREVLDLPREELYALLNRHREVPGLLAFLSYVKTGSHNAETVLADAQMRLSAWMDRDLCAVTSRSELDVDALVREPSVLVVEMREADVPRLRPVWNLFCTRLVNHLMRSAASRPGTRLPRPVSLVLDEFASSLGRLPGFESTINTLRGPRVSVLAAVQSLAQIQHVYGAAGESVLAGFNTKIFLPALESVDATYASHKAGVMSAEHVTRIEEAHPVVEGEHRPLSRQVGSVGRFLLHPEEIARPPEHFVCGAPATFFLPGTPPFQAYVEPAWRQPGLAPLCAALAQGHAKHHAYARADPLEWPPAARAGRRRARTNAPTVREKQELREKLGYERAGPEARSLWLELERGADTRPELYSRLADELVQRSSSVQELFEVTRLSGTRNVQANLHYLDYLRLKNSEQRRELDQALEDLQRVRRGPRAGEPGTIEADASSSNRASTAAATKSAPGVNAAASVNAAAATAKTVAPAPQAGKPAARETSPEESGPKRS